MLLARGNPLLLLERPVTAGLLLLSAVLLASDAASLMTGAIVLADGGYTCW